MQKLINSLVVLLLYSATVPRCQTARILAIFAVNSKSHFSMYGTLMEALADSGHEVVVVNHFPKTRHVPNYMDIDISGSLPAMANNFTIESSLQFRSASGMKYAWFNARGDCKFLLSHRKIQTLLQSNETFDLLIKEMSWMDCFAGFSFKFKAPLIGMVTCVPLPWDPMRIGNPDNPAYSQGYHMAYINKMNFWQRLSNTLYNIMGNLGQHFFCDLPTNVMLKEYFGADVPTIQEILGKTSVILVNTHFSINEPRPILPGYVEVGGLHITEPKPLPKDIQEFIDESEHGIVYFSMGSLVQVQSFPPEKIQAFLNTFASLPERVLMKYTGDKLPWMPRNLMISKWIPQRDVLCHPKTKLFISHGGMMGSQESVYCGVPILGIPLFADQELNTERLKSIGMAARLDYDYLNKDDILNSVRNVIDNRSYKENAKRVSALFKDRPMSPLDTAVYWVEYVIRHRGAPHLRSAGADLPLYQYLLLDVIGFLLLVATVIIFTAHLVYKALFRAVMISKTKRD